MVALVRHPVRARELLSDEVELAAGDVTDPASPKGAAYERSKQLAEALVLATAGDTVEVVIVHGQPPSSP